MQESQLVFTLGDCGACHLIQALDPSIWLTDLGDTAAAVIADVKYRYDPRTSAHTQWPLPTPPGPVPVVTLRTRVDKPDLEMLKGAGAGGPGQWEAGVWQCPLPEG